VADKSSRYFSVTPAAGKTCEIKVDGASVSGLTPTSYPTGYLFTNVTANGHTIEASEVLSGTFRTVTATWISSTGGYLVSTPVGINNGSSVAKFADGATVTLKCNTGFAASNWTGDCALIAVGDTCVLPTLAADKVVGAYCTAVAGGTGPIKNETKGTWHQTLAEATGAATTNDVIKVSTEYVSGGLTTGTPGVTVNLSGGWDSGFSTQTKPSPTSMGALTITNVAVIADNLTI
jgi:hypothetical protein